MSDPVAADCEDRLGVEDEPASGANRVTVIALKWPVG